MTGRSRSRSSAAVLVAGTGGPAGITVDHRSVPLTALGGPGSWAVFRWGLAPAGLATRRQLSASGLRPGGVAPVAELSWRRGDRVAHLYLVGSALPKRPMTPAKWAALAAAMRARRTCPGCHRDAGYVIPRSLGRCLDCADASNGIGNGNGNDGAVAGIGSAQVVAR